MCGICGTQPAAAGQRETRAAGARQSCADVIPRELRKAGARVDAVEAYETVVPKSSRARLRSVLWNPRRRPQVVTFTILPPCATLWHCWARPCESGRIRLAPLGLSFFDSARTGLGVDIAAKEFTIPGLVEAIVVNRTPAKKSDRARSSSRWLRSKYSSLRERATAICRWNVRQQEVSNALVSVDLVFHAGEAVAFVFINLVIDRATALFDSINHLLRL